MTEAITISPDGHRWSIEHGGSVLGHTQTRGEALSIGASLVDWLRSEGRSAAVVERASFLPPGRARGRRH